MRLIYLTRSCSIHDLRFLEAFLRNRVDTGFVSLYKDLEDTPETIPSGICRLGNLGLSVDSSTADLDRAAISFRGLVREFKPDFAQAGPVHDGGYVAARANLAIPWLLQSWAFDVFWECERSGEALRRARIALRKCSILFADCEAVLQRCTQIADAAAMTHFVMPWGVELDRIPNPLPSSFVQKRAEFGDKRVFVFARGLEEIYGITTVLKAFHCLHSQTPNAILILASDGSLRNWVNEFVGRHGLSDSVIIKGQLKQGNLLDLLRQADCCISNSACDGTSVSMLEAMAVGLPVIVSDVHGNREWIIEGENGWRTPPGNVNRLVKAMLKVCSLSATERQEIGEANKSLVRERANWNQNFRRFFDLLNGYRAAKKRPVGFTIHEHSAEQRS